MCGYGLRLWRHSGGRLSSHVAKEVALGGPQFGDTLVERLLLLLGRVESRLLEVGDRTLGVTRLLLLVGFGDKTVVLRFFILSLLVGLILLGLGGFGVCRGGIGLFLESGHVGQQGGGFLHGLLKRGEEPLVDLGGSARQREGHDVVLAGVFQPAHFRHDQYGHPGLRAADRDVQIHSGGHHLRNRLKKHNKRY